MPSIVQLHLDYMGRVMLLSRLVLVPAFLAWITTWNCYGKQHSPLLSQEKRITLAEYLYATLGPRFDCYFTVEEYPRNGIQGWILTTQVTPAPRLASVQAMIFYLRQHVKGVKIESNKANPAVVHIIDERLAANKSYILRKRATIRYSGGIQGLDGALAKKFEAFRGPRQYSTNPLMLDMLTEIRVVAKNLPLRRIVTDYIPLSHYSRLLWYARTFSTCGKLQTDIHYSGPVNLFAEVAPDTERICDFALGETAYARNFLSFREKHDEKYITSAIKFITSRMKKSQPLQVRWAMFFLGKARAKKGIPILLQYLDYRYTTCRVLEESYPAVKALRLIGPPATTPAVAAITKAQTDLRLRLLSQVLISVEGSRGARKILEGQIAKTKLPVQKKRLRTAWRYCISQNQ